MAQEAAVVRHREKKQVTKPLCTGATHPEHTRHGEQSGRSNTNMVSWLEDLSALQAG